jgi:hypothetical protein
MTMQPGKGFGPHQICGDFGGRNKAGNPCQQPAGWKSDDNSGRCHQHDSIAEAYNTSKKAEVLELLPTTLMVNVVKMTGIVPRLIWDWRQSDPIFREEYDAITTGRDRMRAAEVEDKVFERIMTDKASPAETIFFLKNRDPDRWKDIFESKGARLVATAQQLAPVDTAKARLSKKLGDMARRAAAASRTSQQLAQEARSAEESAARQVRSEMTGEEEVDLPTTELPDDDTTQHGDPDEE